MVLLPLSHFSQRSNTAPPLQRGLCSAEAFHVWDGDDYGGPEQERASCLNSERGQGNVVQD